MTLRFSDFILGLSVGIPALNLLKVKRIRHAALWPLAAGLITIIVLFGALISLTVYLTTQASATLGGGWVASILSVLLGIGLVVGVGAVIIVGSTFMLNLVAGLFNERLAIATLTHLRNEPYREEHEPLLVGIKRNVAGELRKFLYFGKWFILILLVNLIPGVGQFLFGVLGLMFSLYALGFEFFSIPLDLERLPFAEKKRFIHSKLGCCLGLGLATLIHIALPVVQLAYLPITVIGATRLVHLVRQQTR